MSRSFAIVAVLVSSGYFAVPAAAQRAPAEGVYTAEQATAGQAVYRAQCSGCHGPTLGGNAGPSLRGETFLKNWAGKSLDELAVKIQNTMPQNAPGKLTREQSVTLVAYILQAGKFPAGKDALTDEASIKQVAFPGGAPAAAATAGGSAAAALAMQPMGNLAQIMRGILFPSSNIIFSVQSQDPGAPKPPYKPDSGGINWADWGAGIYPGWELVDYAAISIGDVAPLLLVPRRCENGRAVPVERTDWVKFTREMVDAAREVLKAAQTRKQDVVSDATNNLADACLNCHVVYRDKEGGTAADPSNKAARCQP
jgi:S-disulfanyl-L-cysteine oxidoreductase SoxD